MFLELYLLLNLHYQTLRIENIIKYNENICNSLNQVVGIKTPMMVASITIIDDDLIVTNRHLGEDQKQLIFRY